MVNLLRPSFSFILVSNSYKNINKKNTVLTYMEKYEGMGILIYDFQLDPEIIGLHYTLVLRILQKNQAITFIVTA